MEKTCIIASRRKGKTMWESYSLIPVSDKSKELSWRRSLGRICKVFPTIEAYREDVSHRASMP